MLAVVLAGGKGTRVAKITKGKYPKPRLLLGRKPVIYYILNALPDAITEIIIVIGHLGEQIQEYCGTEWNGKPIRYVWQTRSGTFGALSSVGDELQDPSLIVNADDLIPTSDLARLCTFNAAVLVSEHPEPWKFGVIAHTVDGNILTIDEQPEHPASNLVNTGAYVLPRRILTCSPEVRGEELLLTPAISELAALEPIAMVSASSWIPVGDPEAIPVAIKALSDWGLLE